jgi:hypothetical protein
VPPHFLYRAGGASREPVECTFDEGAINVPQFHAASKRPQVSRSKLDYSVTLYQLEPLEPRVLLSGVTLITHGFGGGGTSEVDGWMQQMAIQIGHQAGDSNVAIYGITATPSGAVINVSSPVAIGGFAPSATENPEIVLLLDWSSMAGTVLQAAAHSVTIPTNIRDTVSVAAAVSQRMLEQGFLSAIGPHALAELPIHLIGHSRGGSLVTELARDLGKVGVWVDQVTTLDPHPVNSLSQGGNWGDAAMGVPANVVFADNYWRGDGTDFDFDGEPNSGSHPVPLNEDVLNGFGGTDDGLDPLGVDPGYSLEHSDVHLWYHGTIGRTSFPVSDGSANIASNWYQSPHPSRTSSGFYYSRIIGGSRPLDGLWLADGGNGFRPAPVRDTSQQQWPNLTNLSLTNVPADGNFRIGSQLTASYRYGFYDNTPTDTPAQITWYLDSDKNPYNGRTTFATASTADGTGGGISGIRSFAGTIPAVPTPGVYYINAEVSGNGQRRTVYSSYAYNFLAAIPTDTPPTAQPVAPVPITTAGGTGTAISVEYRDNSAVNIASFSTGDVLVTGPNNTARSRHYRPIRPSPPTAHRARRRIGSRRPAAPGMPPRMALTRSSCRPIRSAIPPATLRRRGTSVRCK